MLSETPPKPFFAQFHPDTVSFVPLGHPSSTQFQHL